MPERSLMSTGSLRWRLAGVVAVVLLGTMVVGCMSGLIIDSIKPVSTGPVGVTTDASGVVMQEGNITVGKGCEQEVFFPVPYAAIPNLEVSEPSCVTSHFHLKAQEKTSFLIENKDEFFSRTFHWKARGVRELQPGAVPLALPAPKEQLPPVPVPVTAPK